MPELTAEIKLYRDLFLIATENAQPHFELASRMYALYRGHKPWQLEGTSAQIMVNLAFAMCEERKIKLKKNMLGGEDFVSLDALHPRFENGREQAEAWLRNTLRDESQINMLQSIDPTLQSALALGNAYRMPYARKRKNGSWFVSSRDVDYFQILPIPGGGKINPQNYEDDDALPGFFFIDWPTDDQIKNLEAFPGYKKAAAEALFASGVVTESGIDNQYRELSNIIGAVNYGQGKNNWRTRINDVIPKDGKGRRRRVVHWFSRADNKWRIIAQDLYMVYEGPLPMGEGILPLVNYKITNDFNNFWGIGAIEMVEDLIVAYLLNKNYRLDHLSRVMFPALWIREDIMGGRPESDFYQRPYAVHQFPRTVQRLSDAMTTDRMPEVSPQTFMEDADFKSLMETVGGSPNMAETLGGSNAVGSSATGTLSFINQASGRVDAEAMLLEYGGLSQECRQLLILAGKYINEEEFVHNAKSPNGMGWMSVDAENLGDFYVIRTHGTKSTADENQKFNRLLALYPLWNGDPGVDQFAMKKEIAGASGVSNLTALVKAPQPETQGGEPSGEPGAEPGGLAAPTNVRNQSQAVAGATRSANAPM